MFHVEHLRSAAPEPHSLFHVEQLVALASDTPGGGQSPLSFGIAPAELLLIGLEPAGVVLC